MGIFFIVSKKKLINIHQLYKSWKFFLKMQHVFDTSIFSSKYVKQIIGSFHKALHFLQFDILNME